MSSDTSPFCVFVPERSRIQLGCSSGHATGVRFFRGRVGEWLKPADCKSAAPCGLRRFESFPVHQDSGPATSFPADRVVGRRGTQDVAATPQEIALAMFERGTEIGATAVWKLCAAFRCFAGSGSAWVAQLVERVLGKDEVTGSIPVPGSRVRKFFQRISSFTQSQFSGLGGGNSTVESHSSKVMVAGSNPVPRSRFSAESQHSTEMLALAVPLHKTVCAKDKSNGEGKI